MVTLAPTNLYLARWTGGGVNYKTRYFLARGQAAAVLSASSRPPRYVPVWAPQPTVAVELVANAVRGGRTSDWDWGCW